MGRGDAVHSNENPHQEVSERRYRLDNDSNTYRCTPEDINMARTLSIELDFCEMDVRIRTIKQTEILVANGFISSNARPVHAVGSRKVTRIISWNGITRE